MPAAHAVATIAGLNTTAVKGTRLRTVEALDLHPGGAHGDRRFYVIDAAGRMVNGKQLGDLQAVVADFSDAAGTLALGFPDGARVQADVELGEPVSAQFFSRPRQDRLVLGPFADALSAFIGQPLRLVHTASAVDRGAHGAASLISRASLRRLAEIGGQTAVDPRRFRMLIEADGLAAHEEDGWVAHRVRVGAAVVRWHGHVGRCLITSRDPETGEIDLPTLDLLGSYRRDLTTTEPLPFGIYGEVVSGGRVTIGDPILLDE